MYLKPYLYYRQQYTRLNKPDEAGNDSAEIDSKAAACRAEDAERALDKVVEAEKKDVNMEPKTVFEHSRFQEIAPGVFQFKHQRPNKLQPQTATALNCNENFALASQPDKKPQVDEFVRIGTFPGASDYGLPVYQFT